MKETSYSFYMSLSREGEEAQKVKRWGRCVGIRGLIGASGGWNQRVELSRTHFLSLSTCSSISLIPGGTFWLWGTWRLTAVASARKELFPHQLQQLLSCDLLNLWLWLSAVTVLTWFPGPSVVRGLRLWPEGQKWEMGTHWTKTMVTLLLSVHTLFFPYTQLQKCPWLRENHAAQTSFPQEKSEVYWIPFSLGLGKHIPYNLEKG